MSRTIFKLFHKMKISTNILVENKYRLFFDLTNILVEKLFLSKYTL